MGFVCFLGTLEIMPGVGILGMFAKWMLMNESNALTMYGSVCFSKHCRLLMSSRQTQDRYHPYYLRTLGRSEESSLQVSPSIKEGDGTRLIERL